MRKLVVISLATMIAVTVAAFAILIAAQPGKSYVEIKNPYYPFTVEMQVRDR